MLKNRRFIFLIPAVILFFTLSSCTKKEGPEVKTGQDSTNLVSGEKVNLVYKPQKGDVLRYKVVNTSSATENSPVTQGKDFTEANNVTMYYTQEVNEISESGTATYKVTFDSVSIGITLTSGDSSISQTYNSNVKDSVYAKPDYLQFNALVHNPFKMRVSPQGEILETYELENVHNAVYKIYGDTLSDKEKEVVKESMGTGFFKQLLQNSFQKFPDVAIAKDSSWILTDNSQLMVFPVKIILSYKLSDIKNENGNVIITLDAALGHEFIEKQVKEKDVTATVEDSKTSGSGKININLTKGYVTSKQTNVESEMSVKMIMRGQPMNTKQKMKQTYTLELLK